MIGIQLAIALKMRMDSERMEEWQTSGRAMEATGGGEQQEQHGGRRE
jgi:hypothetical protein